MKTWMAWTVIMILVAGGVAQGATPSDAGKPEAPVANGQKPKKKTTEVSFDEVLVEGRYHFSDEAVTTVEQDKVLDALLGVRTDFKDRLKKSASRH